MSTKAKYKSGSKVGEHGVTFVKESRSHKGRRLAIFKCACGVDFESITSNVKSGATKSCGCLSKRILQERNFKHGKAKRGGRTRLYRVLANMKTRCSNPNVKSFINYGARGISVCDEWSNDFSLFYEWAINNGYDDSKVIDRIDNNMGYSPENCRFVTVAENNKNKGARLNSKTGISGVRRRGRGFCVRIRSNMKDITVGTFPDFFEACCARKSAENRYWND